MNPDTPTTEREVKFRTPHERLSNVDEVTVIKVVQVKSLVGIGDGNGTPGRQITEWFTLDGKRIARYDPLLDEDVENIHHWAEEQS